ncbi:MAG: hypothetical protein Kow0098_16670 [Ignavibacteriaceae bacterium]
MIFEQTHKKLYVFKYEDAKMNIKFNTVKSDTFSQFARQIGNTYYPAVEKSADVTRLSQKGKIKLILGIAYFICLLISVGILIF